MRKTLFILFSFVFTCSFAQRTKVKNLPEFEDKIWHWGFSIGLNAYDFNFRRSADFARTNSLYPDVSRLEPGFQINTISEIRLGKYWNLRFLPGINFGQRKLIYMKDNLPYSSMRIESNFLDFPFVLKYKAKRVNNYAPYLLTGFACRWDLAARKTYDPDNGVFVKLKPLDFYWEVGFGIDYYLFYCRFSTELKLSLGIRDVLVHDFSSTRPEYVRSIDRLTSKLVLLSFHIQ